MIRKDLGMCNCTLCRTCTTFTTLPSIFIGNRIWYSNRKYSAPLYYFQLTVISSFKKCLPCTHAPFQAKTRGELNTEVVNYIFQRCICTDLNIFLIDRAYLYLWSVPGLNTIFCLMVHLLGKDVFLFHRLWLRNQWNLFRVKSRLFGIDEYTGLPVGPQDLTEAFYSEETSLVLQSKSVKQKNIFT